MHFLSALRAFLGYYVHCRDRLPTTRMLALLATRTLQAVFKLPSNLGTSESYVLELETNGLFGTGLFDNTLAISQEFPVASKRDKERHLREIAERNAAKYEEAAAELAKTKEEAMEGNAVEGNAAPTVVPVVVKPVAVKPVVAVAPPTVAPATPVAGESASAPAKFFDLW